MINSFPAHGPPEISVLFRPSVAAFIRGRDLVLLRHVSVRL